MLKIYFDLAKSQRYIHVDIMINFCPRKICGYNVDSRTCSH